MFQIEEELKKLPAKPGVYIMHDQDDAIIYVGKAISLRNRVRSYFRESTNKSPKIEKMVTKIARFEYIVTDSELEALVLENNLIKEHNPKYNTMLKDDKTYPYIKVTMGEDFPRVLFSRQMKKDKSRYFGPFTSAFAVKDTIELINKLYKLDLQPGSAAGYRAGAALPELSYRPVHGALPGVCDEGGIPRAGGAGAGFPEWKFCSDPEQPEAEDGGGVGKLEFEDAIRYRDLYNSVKQVAQKQKITDSDGEDKDIIALARDENDAVVQVFFVRGGKLIGREHFIMTRTQDCTQAQVLLDFVKQFYAGTPFIPRELMLQHEIEDIPVLEQWLSARKGSRVYIRVPKKGTKEKLVELAATNAKLVLSKDRERIKREEGRTIGAVKEICALLSIPEANRMEAFDISNISGFENVGSMVVYEKGKPKRSDYRKFRIKTVSGPDDYACMKEVLTRRFRHGMEETKELEDKQLEKEFGSFTRFPDLLLMDGGKGQVNVALQVLSELGLSIPVCGMVKDDNHRTRGLYYQNREIEIDTRSEGFKLITRIQDEAHRFAIEYHRSLRSKEQVRSVLDGIPGVGPARRKALMRDFRSIDEIRQADVERLSQVPEIPEHIAEEIYSFFHGSVLK